jgi:putative Holliday junction resolvase
VRAAGSSVLALDVGNARVGVAVASLVARLPRPLTTLKNDDSIFEEILRLASAEDAGVVVVGLPRGLDGQHTKQTVYAEDFAEELKQHVGLPVQMQDEAVTSKQAEAELKARGKEFDKGDIDALAATYILEDFLRDYRENF